MCRRCSINVRLQMWMEVWTQLNSINVQWMAKSCSWQKQNCRDHDRKKKKCLHDADTKTKSGGLSPGGGIDRGSGGRTGVWVGNPRVCILPRPYLAKHPLYSHHIIPPPPPKKKSITQKQNGHCGIRTQSYKTQSLYMKHDFRMFFFWYSNHVSDYQKLI